MTHREKALWAAVTALLFAAVAIGLLIWFRDDYTKTGAGPSVIAAMAIGFAMATYSSRETRRWQEEKERREPLPPYMYKGPDDTEVCACGAVIDDSDEAVDAAWDSFIGGDDGPAPDEPTPP